jgi:hypothetical protein
MPHRPSYGLVKVGDPGGHTVAGLPDLVWRQTGAPGARPCFLVYYLVSSVNIKPFENNKFLEPTNAIDVSRKDPD